MLCSKRLITILNKSQYIINRKKEVNIFNAIHHCKYTSNATFQEYIENEEEKEMYTKLCHDYLGTVTRGNKVFILQPYIKWGNEKKRNTTPELQLAEAKALIDTLPYWSVVGGKLVPLLSLQKNQLVGSGTMETLKKDIQSCPHVTAIFVSTNLLKFIQIAELQQSFHLPVYDRYSIIIHIFREHARTSEAKLQVALAEIPYIKQKMVDLDNYRIQKRVNFNDKAKAFLHTKEKKLKNMLVKLKKHRQLIKQQRNRYGYPNIAIVGYTNAGKTSLIKALTGDIALKPEDKLFATLDTTIHHGYLPNCIKVLYIDTIGFIQDVPEILIEPFKVTLEDTINAEIIIHVFDISHPDVKAQVQHVQETVQSMVDENKLIINVANKCDLVDTNTTKSIVPEDTLYISATKLTGIDLLRSKLEENVISVANITKKRVRVKNGSAEASWLYKQTTVLSAEPDSNNFQYLIMDILMTKPIFYEFKRIFRL